MLLEGLAILLCTCIPPDVGRDLPQAEGAFVGTVVSREERPAGASTAHPVRWTFDVETAVKGGIGRRVEVLAAIDSASCGLELPVGARVGLLLDREGGDWTSSLCRQVDPARLAGLAPAGGTSWLGVGVAGAVALAVLIAFRRRA